MLLLLLLLNDGALLFSKYIPLYLWNVKETSNFHQENIMNSQESNFENSIHFNLKFHKKEKRYYIVHVCL